MKNLLCRMGAFIKTNIKIILFFVIIGVIVYAGYNLLFKEANESTVEFEEINKEEAPEQLLDILPRYQALERALAVKVEDEYYLVVTRGEKPTTGYNVSIDKIFTEMDEEGNMKLIVHADFSDPNANDELEEVVTYPISIAKVNIDALPYKIQLKSKMIE